ncbi:hypothetical protein J3F83DRAFT_729331 [Trichoderma novae-zelandiae]
MTAPPSLLSAFVFTSVVVGCSFSPPATAISFSASSSRVRGGGSEPRSVLSEERRGVGDEDDILPVPLARSIDGQDDGGRMKEEEKKRRRRGRLLE